MTRRLPAFGRAVNACVICSDKNGARLLNEMRVMQLEAGSQIYDVSAIGDQPRGNFSEDGTEINPQSGPTLAELSRPDQLGNDFGLHRTGGGIKVERDVFVTKQQKEQRT